MHALGLRTIIKAINSHYHILLDIMSIKFIKGIYLNEYIYIYVNLNNLLSPKKKFLNNLIFTASRHSKSII